MLGALMLNNDAWFDVLDILAPTDFYRPQHRIVFEAMAALSRDNQPLDAVTVSESLQSSGLLEKAGGIAYLAELVDGTPGASNVAAYARIVRDRSTLRKLIAAANQIVEKAFTPGGRTDEELLDLAEQKIFNISEDRTKSDGPQAINPLLDGDRAPGQGAVREQGRHRRAWQRGFSGPRQPDRGSPEVRSHHRCRPALHGQDIAGHEHRRACDHEQRRSLPGSSASRCRRISS